MQTSILENLRFLCIEVDSQLAGLNKYFSNPSPALARQVVDRSNYVYSLKGRIHTSCVNRLASLKNDEVGKSYIRSVELIATHLELVTSLVEDCIKQTGHINNPNSLPLKLYHPMLEKIRRGIEMVQPAVSKNDTELALKIGQIEQETDLEYERLIKQFSVKLKGKKCAEYLTSALLIAHAIEQMGDALLSISEAMLSANLGQAINFNRYFSSQSSIAQLDEQEDITDVQIESIAETRSGSTISGVSVTSGKEDEFVAIFKEGEKRKLKAERQGVQSWHEIYPDLAPKILSYKKRGKSAALLIEHLPGFTFEQILLYESRKLLQETLDQLAKTLKSVWRETRTNKPICPHFMQQLQKRLSPVYKIHPEFRQPDCSICGLNIPSFDTLIEQAVTVENNLQAPFSVYIHGDFNVDNIIYDPVEQRINFIDLHRSRHMDYVQDVSVFMVSNYRLQILDPEIRRRIMRLARDFYLFARKFADKVGDETFELRLALGLARSFATSTRFILDKSLARSLWLRSAYILQRVLEADLKKPSRFKLPIQEIFVG